MPPLLDVLLWLAAAVWVALGLRALRTVLALERLPRRAPDAPDLPHRVSVVIPARDEAAHVEGAIANALTSRGVAVEVIVVDDRSADDTAGRARAAAAGDARVRVLRVDELPAGWLGKPHACQRAGEIARGDWILFTDADVRMQPDVLARALAAGIATRAQHVVVAPGVEGASFAARVGFATFAGTMTERLARANRDAREGWVGIGAFNLVEAAAWRTIGGHRKLAYEVVDDMKLGLLLHRAGFRTRGWIETRDLLVDWGVTLGSIPRLLEKNLFAFTGFRLELAFGMAAGALALWAAGPLGAWRGGPAGWTAFGAWCAIGAVAAFGALRIGDRPFTVAFVPLGLPVLAWAMVRSTCMTLARGGVAWRGTLYPLAELRARCVR